MGRKNAAEDRRRPSAAGRALLVTLAVLAILTITWPDDDESSSGLPDLPACPKAGEMIEEVHLSGCGTATILQHVLCADGARVLVGQNESWGFVGETLVEESQHFTLSPGYAAALSDCSGRPADLAP